MYYHLRVEQGILNRPMDSWATPPASRDGCPGKLLQWLWAGIPKWRKCTQAGRAPPATPAGSAPAHSAYLSYLGARYHYSILGIQVLSPEYCRNCFSMTPFTESYVLSLKTIIALLTIEFQMSGLSTSRYSGEHVSLQIRRSLIRFPGRVNKIYSTYCVSIRKFITGNLVISRGLSRCVLRLISLLSCRNYHPIGLWKRRIESTSVFAHCAHTCMGIVLICPAPVENLDRDWLPWPVWPGGHYYWVLV